MAFTETILFTAWYSNLYAYIIYSIKLKANVTIQWSTIPSDETPHYMGYNKIVYISIGEKPGETIPP